MDGSDNVFNGGTNISGTGLPTTTGAYDEVHNGIRMRMLQFNNTLTILSACTYLGDHEEVGLVLQWMEAAMSSVGYTIKVKQTCPRQLAPMTKSTMAIRMCMLPNLTTR